VNPKRIHKFIGILLAIPLLGWSLTGIVFLTKPGYEGAFEQLAIKTYPLEESFDLGPVEGWHEARLVKTLLGYHLLLGTGDRSAHLNPSSLEPLKIPSDTDLKRLIEDAISVNADRYGVIVNLSGNTAITSTGVEVTLNWPDLSLVQSGSDTRLINNLYRIHYLQWSGRPLPDTVFGVAGIILLLVLTVLGLAGFFWSRRE